ncbi:AbrB/MazE/SpoVT family DNA-binding domain-containing protein [Desulfobacula phenolica]|uniref:Antitoxin MazE n=1 Tax=Desulfobacula phenolica TaxID=90732 RepID=A0A1H2EEI3_9BACT|nr:AbrB/MazE/SpoVT family DNA-binding domain-containing protein [Desulfobacula phenolica]SDT93511.1 antitoxin MazE [Desulfobacula phenolica]
MEMIIKKWGNSLAARIPKAIADMIGLHLNQKINIKAENGKIIITPITEKKEYTMDELLSQCTAKNLELNDEDKAWLNDEPVGREW